MADLLTEIIAQPRSLFEEVNGRPESLVIFISSRLAGYKGVRQRCAETIEATGMMQAWYWERDAHAGPASAPHVCLWRVGTSDALILIVGEELSHITRQEYEAARGRHIPTFIFIDERKKQTNATLAFIEAEQSKVTTVPFRNHQELRSNVLEALRKFNSESWRTASHAYYKQRRGTP
jgi:hypothetical protein